MLYRCSRGYLLLHSQDEHRLGTFRNDWTEWWGGGGDGPTVTTVRRGTKQQLRQKLEALTVRPRKAVGVF